MIPFLALRKDERWLRKCISTKSSIMIVSFTLTAAKNILKHFFKVIELLVEINLRSHLSAFREVKIGPSDKNDFWPLFLQNFVAHKKYYCSASAKAKPPPAPVQVASDEDEEPVASAAPRVKRESDPHPPKPPSQMGPPNKTILFRAS